MKNENGLTLIEVLASLVIISIVLTGFMALFGTTNKLAVSNSEKLVVVNLADSYLERVKANPKEFITPFPPTIENQSKGIPQAVLEMNNKKYEIEVKVTQSNDEFNKLSLVNVVVKVKSKNSNMSSSVEGYVPYVKPSS